MNKIKENENLVKNSNQPQSREQIEDFNGNKIEIPSQKWLDGYMKFNIKLGLISKIESSIDNILQEFEEEIESCWTDPEYRLNFPYKSLEEVLEYYNDEYLDLLDSELIYKFKKFLNEQRKTVYNLRKGWSKEEKEFEEYITI